MPLNIEPPLLNSASPWATTLKDLKLLYDSPYTGAVTTRTCLLKGFEDDPKIHRHCFVEDQNPSKPVPIDERHARYEDTTVVGAQRPITSLNTYGYSPHALTVYMSWLDTILLEAIRVRSGDRNDLRIKPIIISVTGNPAEIASCYTAISSQLAYIVGTLQDSERVDMISLKQSLKMEINLSCPNIAGAPPPAYSSDLLRAYFTSLQDARQQTIDKSGGDAPILRVGIKIPPYTYQTQFQNLIDALTSSTGDRRDCPIDFITATNTLGSSLLLEPSPSREGYSPILSNASGTGVGGLAGAALHPLSLGNVATLRRMLDASDVLSHIDIIGVGGVADQAGFERMRSAGAAAVGVATALGVDGVGVFERILGKEH